MMMMNVRQLLTEVNTLICTTELTTTHNAYHISDGRWGRYIFAYYTGCSFPLR